MAGDKRGRQVGSRPLQSGEGPANLDLGTSIAAAAERQGRLAGKERLRLRVEDLHRQVRRQEPRRLVVFAVDSSDSMGDGPAALMTAALGAAMALTAEAYLNRDLVSLVTFRASRAEVLVPPTESVTMVRRHLRQLPVGGATPLAAGLQQAMQIISQTRSRYSGLSPLLVLISDGDATVSITPGGDPAGEALRLTRRLQREKIPTLLINTSTSATSRGIMPLMADILGTNCYHIRDLQAGQILKLIDRQATDRPS